MVMLKQRKVTKLGDEARDAAARGDDVFAPIINYPTRRSSSQNHQDVADAVSSIVAEGWTLLHWAVAYDSKSSPFAAPVFVRAPQ